MNLINLFLILIILLLVLEGIHRGFLRSALNLGVLFLSIITAFIFHASVSTAVQSNEKIFNYLVYYIEGEEMVATIEDSRLLVENLTGEQIEAIVDNAKTSEPFTSLIRQNLHDQAFAKQGSHTVGEYFNMSIVSAVLNILSFLAVYLISRVIFAFVLGSIDYTVVFPELRQYDRLCGALFGALRGFVFCMLVATIFPVLLLILPVQKVTEYFTDSNVAMFFYDNNIFLHLIRGII